MTALYAALASLGFGICFNLHGYHLILVAIGGGLGWLGFLAAAAWGEYVQYLIASVVITLFAEVMSRKCRTPGTVFLAPTLIPLVPGGALYETMLHALNQENELFLSTGIRAITITIIIAFGIVITSSIVRIALHKPKK